MFVDTRYYSSKTSSLSKTNPLKISKTTVPGLVDIGAVMIICREQTIYS